MRGYRGERYSLEVSEDDLQVGGRHPYSRLPAGAVASEPLVAPLPHRELTRQVTALDSTEKGGRSPDRLLLSEG